jgi:hypothetical protein
MKHNSHFYAWKSTLPIVAIVILNNVAMAQVPPDTTKTKVDTTATTVVPTDTIKPAQADTTAVQPTTDQEEGKSKKRFSIYGGGNANTMSGSTDKYSANSGVGYHFGVAWETSGFFYWQFGLRYSEAKYAFNSKATSKDTGDLKVQSLNVPITAGINFLSFLKIVSLRVFVSAIPSFTLGVSDNNFGVNKDAVNSFIFYGQAGIGVNILFAYVDVGYNYGTGSLLENSVSSTHPGQAYVSLGIRF